MNYHEQKKTQIGVLSFRRLRKRAVILFISFNIWLDIKITNILSGYFGMAADYIIGPGLRIFLLIFSILFWIETYLALKFAYADYFCTKEETGKKQMFLIIAIIFNLFLFKLLIEIG